MLLLGGIVTVIVTSIVIMYACNPFEEAADYLGRNMQDGIKGATINAIGSSLPELFTTTFLLFLYHDYDGFSAGIATCAGSAVFNMIVIPGLSILTVLFIGKKAKYIEISRKVLLRDGFFFIIAEIILILFLQKAEITFITGIILLNIYFLYLSFLGGGRSRNIITAETYIDEKKWRNNRLISLMKFDYREVFFYEKKMTTYRAWMILIPSVITIGTACYFLAEATIDLSIALGVPSFLAAVIFAAAATSVPDTVLSLKDSLKGSNNDMVSNAIGSNIFDITVCIGLPTTIYTLMYGKIPLSSTTEGHSSVQGLRIALLVVTAIVLGILSSGKLGKIKALMLFSLYGIWLWFVLTY